VLDPDYDTSITPRLHEWVVRGNGCRPEAESISRFEYSRLCVYYEQRENNWPRDVRMLNRSI
jgi:hypothetical protein